ncbi:calcium-dependent protein kinase 3-like [Papaver somniferum]|uniref:calcium-dependent protein kinase 3-like n=1 Tax=Papaver somniferum TaxID=3469 RepID=UPI000E6F6626|nr:calcium-dependent protein kinase 3-like [Papaver somniferum]
MAGSLSPPAGCGIGRCWAGIKRRALRWSNSSKSTLTSFDDRYKLGKELGSGNNGVVRECYDKKNKQTCACKSIAKERLVKPDDIPNVKLEVDIMKRLSGHSNIVNLKEVYEDANSFHLVMELCAGGDLYHHMQKSKRLSEFNARLLFRQLVLVVAYCHENGVVHRDLKPGNILLATKGSKRNIKLTDFGIATYFQPGETLQKGTGTPHYVAPEVLTGKGYNNTADIWSAGVILYFLLGGKVPFTGPTKLKILHAVVAGQLRFPSDPWEQISASAKDLISKILRLDPAKRITAPQILDHPWMTQDVNSVS